MTKLVLFSAENIARAKEDVKPLMREFLNLEPGNLLVIPETRQGMAVVNQAFARLETIGYSQEDIQLLLNEVVGDLSEPKYSPPSGSGSSHDSNF